MNAPLEALCRDPRRLDGDVTDSRTPDPQHLFGCFSRPASAKRPPLTRVPFARYYARLR